MLYWSGMAKYFLSWAPLASASCLITSKVGCLVLKLSTKLWSMFPVGDRVGDHRIFVALMWFRFGQSLECEGRECITSDEYVPIRRICLALGAGLHQFPRVQQARVHVTDKQQPSSPTRWMHGVHSGATWPFTAKVLFSQPCVLFNLAEGHNSVMPLVKSTWMLRKKKPCAWCAHRPVMGDPTSLVQLSGGRILWCSDFYLKISNMILVGKLHHILKHEKCRLFITLSILFVNPALAKRTFTTGAGTPTACPWLPPSKTRRSSMTPVTPWQPLAKPRKYYQGLSAIQWIYSG